MFDLSSVILLALVALVALLFWQRRQQHEYAHAHAVRYCNKEQLQLLDIARTQGRLAWTRRGPAWQTDFVIGFSSDGQSRYEGTLRMLNLQLQGVDLPVFREPPPTASKAGDYRESSPYH